MRTDFVAGRDERPKLDVFRIRERRVFLAHPERPVFVLGKVNESNRDFARSYPSAIA